MTLDDLIARLTAIRDRLPGGDVSVVVDDGFETTAVKLVTLDADGAGEVVIDLTA